MSRRPRSRWGRRGVSGEGGAALPLALLTLVGLTTLALALLAISALDPQISRNHADWLRARDLAEAGLEYAFDTLATTAGAWDALLAGATCTTGAGLLESSLPGAGPAHGTFIVRVRNDCAAADQQLTGMAPETSSDAATRDTNGRVLVASTGTIGATAHTVRAIISYDPSSVRSGQSVPRGQVTAYGWADE